METDHSNDLRAFRGFIDEQLAGAGSHLTLEEALILWEYEHVSPEEREETIQSIRRGLDDLYAGRVADAFEFTERMRTKIRATAKP